MFLVAVLLVYFCLFVYHLFMLVFVVILTNKIICKQICLLYCFVFVAFVYNLNVKQCEYKTPVSRFFIFVTILCFQFFFCPVKFAQHCTYVYTNNIQTYVCTYISSEITLHLQVYFTLYGIIS